MTPREIQERLSISNFREEQDLDLLMRYDKRHPNAYACNENGQVIGLNLRSLGLRDDKVEFLWELKGLQALNLSENELTALHLPHWPALRYLNLSENKGLRALSFQAGIPGLQWADLGECTLDKLHLPPGFDALEKLFVQKNQLRRLEFQGDCPELELLDASHNKLSRFSLPQGFEKLAFLYLNNNQLVAYELSSTLSEIDTLRLEQNQLEDITAPQLQRTPNVQLLRLNDNPLPPPLVSSISGNLRESLKGLRDYHRDIAKGAGYDKEYKVLLVGNGGVGKSCLLEKLMTGKFKEKWESTDGISLRRYEKLEGATLNFWDFGGQDIYHATHRLFMQARAIYLVLWDPDTEKKPFTERKEDGQTRRWGNEPLSYWLDYVHYFGKGSPAIVVQTKKEKYGVKDHPRQASLRERYGEALKLEFLHIDSKPDDSHRNGFRKLLGSIEDAIHQLRRSADIPLNWMKLRELIRQKQENMQHPEDKTLSLQDFLEMATAPEIDVENPMNALRWLTESGVVFYQKGLFHNKILLHQEWAINAVYTILKREGKVYYRFQAQDGQFTGKDLVDYAWQNYAPAERELFIKFMISCELCFEITRREEDRWRHVPFEERRFLAPELLPKDKPRSVQKAEQYWERDDSRRVLYVRYVYDFLHRGILQRFIVRTQELAKVGDIWKNGILLEKEGEDAIVQSPGKKEILVKVQESGKALLAQIRQLLEELQEGEGREWVSLDGEAFVDFEKLKGWEEPYLEGEKEGRSVLVAKADYDIFLHREEKAMLHKATRAILSPEFFKKSGEGYGIAKEIEGIQRALDVLIRKKSDFALELAKAYDAGKAFGLREELSKLEEEIADYRQQIENLKAQLPETRAESSTRPFSQKVDALQSQALQLQQETSSISLRLNSQTGKAVALKILFLTANPATTTRISWEKEHSRVSIEISSGNLLIPLPSATIKEMIDAIAEHSPHIVHFCGHGQEGDPEEGIPAGLAFQNEEKNAPALIGADKLRAIFRRLKKRHPHLKVVLLNACYSEAQARAISELGIYAVGTSDKIQSLAARHFAAGFYRLYQRNQDVIAAIDHGITQGMAYDGDIEDMVRLYYNGKYIEV